MSVAVDRAKRLGRRAEDLLQRALATAGAAQTEAKISGDSQAYWGNSKERRWRSNSHWRDSEIFDGNELWTKIGREHLAMFERGATAVGFERPWGRVVDWGCGGGSSAVSFAPHATELAGVDVSEVSVRECGKQVAAACDTPFRAAIINVAEPEKAVAELGGTERFDVFISFYVFELIPTQAYGERILRIARDLLRPGGIALIQIKYDDGGWWTRPRRRAYRSGLAQMTTYTIPRFWQLAENCGLKPRSVELVPSNELDQRYAYFFLSKEGVR